MDEYVCIYATGTFIRDIAKSLVEKKLAVRADLMESYPVYLKNNKPKVGSNSNIVLLLVERVRLNEVMETMQSLNKWNPPLTAYAVPVLTTIGINPMGETDQ